MKQRGAEYIVSCFGINYSLKRCQNGLVQKLQQDLWKARRRNGLIGKLQEDLWKARRQNGLIGKLQQDLWKARRQNGLVENYIILPAVARGGRCNLKGLARLCRPGPPRVKSSLPLTNPRIQVISFKSLASFQMMLFWTPPAAHGAGPLAW